ncbi:MAG: HEAT repeat domain-containing protein [bacterium]|nr:HEAT repeat domain-containing protein [bacterium]
MEIIDAWLDLPLVWRAVSSIGVVFGLIGLPGGIVCLIDLILQLRDPRRYWINRLSYPASYEKTFRKLLQIGISEEEIFEILLESVKTNSPVHSSHALDILRRTRQSRAVQLVIDQLDKGDLDIYYAAKYLGEIGDAKAIQPLADLFDNPKYESNGIAIAMELLKIGPDHCKPIVRDRYIHPFLAHLKAEPPYIRKSQLRDMGRLLALVGDDDVAKSIADLLSKIVIDATRKLASGHKFEISEHQTNYVTTRVSGDWHDLIASIKTITHILGLMKNKCVIVELSKIRMVIPDRMSVERPGALFSHSYRVANNEMCRPIDELIHELRSA